MRHGKKINHLGRTASHRKAMLSNMASSLITHKRINTTVAKAKSLQRYIEPLITKSKTDDTNNRRVVFSYLQDKEAVAELFREVAPKIADRPGGYTRIIKTGFRQGDGADMAMIELVDFNELYTSAKPEKKTRRSRRGSSKAAETETKTEETVEEVKAEAAEEAPAVEEAKVEEPKAETAEEPTAEEGTEEKKD
ncbi:50S ribosomal protein L17 [Moheibacter lacus]|uniref:Large ribosomal subunit protein bL17 n=1 Tax=Moheibacter lacus TaxID=2745851 RepID=A0A838ZTP7_9FLAO|nr:50S ribosomal protein L17 [Moheibacter lacus]MBA5630309.1 50S ribosomal protein L17 [Moheibacter lacus]